MLALMRLFNSQILCAVDTLSQGEVVSTVSRENPTIQAARGGPEGFRTDFRKVRIAIQT
jgi:hypothetical protein